MGLFSRKPKVSIEEICQQFYDYEIFQNSAFYDTAFDFVTQGDTSLVIDRNLFERELTALRIELFGLALCHHNRHLARKDEYSRDSDKQSALVKEICDEILFTKKYLELSEKLNIWEAMALYNEEVDQVCGKSDVVNLEGLHPVIAIEVEGGEEARREVKSYMRESLRSMWAEEFKRFIEDSECVSRLLNRSGSDDEKWGEGFISQGLARILAERLGCVEGMNWEGIFRFQALIIGVYNGAGRFIEALPFSPEYRGRLERLLQSMKRAARS